MSIAFQSIFRYCNMCWSVVSQICCFIEVHIARTRELKVETCHETLCSLQLHLPLIVLLLVTISGGIS